MNIIAADPPWEYNVWKGKESRTSDSHYPTMKLDELIAMRQIVDELAGDNCAMFMWGTPPTLNNYAYPLLKSWGFTYKTFGLVWMKLDKKPRDTARSADYPLILNHDGFYKPFLGMGHYTRSNIEVALLGIKGKVTRAKGIAESQLIIAPRREHSRKPDEQYQKIETVFPGADEYIEMFARQQWAGWKAWGNEKDKFTKENNR